MTKHLYCLKNIIQMHLPAHLFLLLFAVFSSRFHLYVSTCILCPQFFCSGWTDRKSIFGTSLPKGSIFHRLLSRPTLGTAKELQRVWSNNQTMDSSEKKAVEKPRSDLCPAGVSKSTFSNLVFSWCVDFWLIIFLILFHFYSSVDSFSFIVCSPHYWKRKA